MRLRLSLIWIFLWMFTFFLNGQINVGSIEKNRILLKVDTTFGICTNIDCILGHEDLFIDTSDQKILIEGLEPATLVQVCATFLKNGIQMYYEMPFMTQSNSSGEIKVYFNNPVDTTFRKNESKPAGVDFGELQLALRNKIRNAKKTIDLAAYNTNEIFLVNELIDAHNRGLRIRVIADDETSNTGWSGGIPFPIIYGNTGSGLMHNKFIIIDEEYEGDSWVITGSMNFTTNQMRKDPNHLLFIQDQSLAKGYTIEFEEMWGSNGPQPNAVNARFGSNKIQNTPTFFMIDNKPVELYFSPSDKTTSRIAEKLDLAKSEQLLALMIFTNWELRDKVVENLQKNIKTRWIVEDQSNSSGVIQAVRNNSGIVNIHTHPDIFHHKYAILDEDTESSVLITGSHNWTFSAETYNDENTLIFNDPELANIFRQEFEARWKEVSTTSVKDLSVLNKVLYPNPTSGDIYFQHEFQRVEVYTMQGNRALPDVFFVSEINLDVPPGMYILKLHSFLQTHTIKVIKL